MSISWYRKGHLDWRVEFVTPLGVPVSYGVATQEQAYMLAEKIMDWYLPL